MTIVAQSVRKPSRVYLRRGHPLTQRLVAVWPLFEGGGTTTHDVSGYQRHGTISGPDWTLGPLGPTLDFTASDDDFVDTGWDGITGSQNRTFVVLFNTSTNAEQMFTYNGNFDANGEKWVFRIDESSSAGTWVLRVEVAGGFIRGSTHITDGDWHQGICSLRGDNVTDISLVVDGSLETVDDSSAQAINTTVSNSGEQFRIGQRNTDADSVGARTFDGAMGWVLVYDYGMPVDAMKFLSENPLAPFITKPR